MTYDLHSINNDYHVQGTWEDGGERAQQAWIMNCTLRENVLFGKPFNEERYTKVIDACGLKQNLTQFVGGDKVIIGDRGTRQRVIILVLQCVARLTCVHTEK